MLTTILTFIASPVGKIVSYVIGGISVVSALVIMLKIHDSSIKNQALLEFNQKQMASVIETQNRTIQQLETLNKIQVDIIDKFNAQNTKIDDQATQINQSLDAIKTDLPSSDILKNVIRQLGNKK